MADEAFVTFDQFDATQLAGKAPEGKQFTNGKGETIKFAYQGLRYNYGTTTDPVVTDLFLEGPEVKAFGIKTDSEEKTKNDGTTYTKTTHSQMIKFDLSNAEHKLFIQKFNEMHAAASFALGSTPWAKMNEFDPKRPGGMFKNPIYWPRDAVTKEILPGEDPSLWVKVRGGYIKTLYTDLNGDPIDWALLRNVEIQYVPLFHVEKTYIGAKASLQIFLASAIVTKLTEVGTTSRQLSTLDRLKAKYGSGDAQDQLESQLAQMRLNRQDQLAAETMGSPQLPGNNTVLDQARPENTGSLQDFLSNAPSMPSQVTMPTQPNVTTGVSSATPQTLTLNIS